MDDAETAAPVEGSEVQESRMQAEMPVEVDRGRGISVFRRRYADAGPGFAIPWVAVGDDGVEPSQAPRWKTTTKVFRPLLPSAANTERMSERGAAPNTTPARADDLRKIRREESRVMGFSSGATCAGTRASRGQGQ